MKKWASLAQALLAALCVAGCGLGGGSPWPDVATARNEAPAALSQAKKPPSATQLPAPAADQLLNWAEINFPGFFPQHSQTLSYGPWLYRAYPGGVLLGVNDGDVYVTGGPFGSGLLRVGAVTDFVRTALPVWPTSYENLHRLPLDQPILPTRAEVTPVEPAEGIREEFNVRSAAFADFMQEGELGAITTSAIYRDVYPGENPWQLGDSPGKVYLLRKGADGRWHDVSDKLLRGSRFVCVTTGFIEIADLNGDQRPDAAFSCSGPDFPIAGRWDHVASKQYAMLSQGDGTYRVVQLAVPDLYSHQLALADVDGDGHVDIVTTNSVWNGIPAVLWGNGDGTFVFDDSVFPAAMRGQTAYGIAAIPVAGQLEVVVAGTQVFRFQGGKFSKTAAYTLPAGYTLALAVIYSDGYYYMLLASPDYMAAAYTRTHAATGQVTILREVIFDGTAGLPSNGIKLDSQQAVVNVMAGCGADTLANPAEWSHLACTMSVPVVPSAPSAGLLRNELLRAARHQRSTADE